MLGFIKKDLLLVRANIKQLIIMSVLFALLSFQGNFDLNFLIPVICLMVFVSTFSYDDFNNWNTYACSLPNSRVNVVKGKYITSLILMVITTIVGVIISLIIGYFKNSIDFMEIGSALLGSSIGIFILISFMYPMIFKFGVEKGRIFIFILVIVIGGIMGTLSSFIDIKVTGFLSFIDNYIYIIVSLVAILFLGFSYLISKKIYLKKEF